MLIKVRNIAGLAGIPKDRTALSADLLRNNVPTSRLICRGGEFEAVTLLDLPEEVQLAYRVRLADEAGLAFEEQDDAAHLALMAKPVGVQQTAHARAKVLGLVHKGVRWV